MIKQILSDIPHNPVTYNMSEGITAINRGLKLCKFTPAFVDEIDDIGNIEITIEESSPTIFQEFTILAHIKTLNILEYIAAYNVEGSLL